MLLKKKSVAILFLIVLLCAGLLSGCGGNTQSQTQDQSTGTQAASSTTTTPPVKDDKTVVADLISQGQKVTEMSYDLVIVGTGMTSDSKVWYKDQRMKAETTANGTKYVTYFDLANGECTQYLPDQNVAYKMNTAAYEGSDSATPIDYSNGLADTNYTINGSETINGMKCRVITVSSEEYSAKEWISEDYGIIVKVQQEYEGTTSTMEFKNIKIGAGTVPDSTFDLPSGVDIMDMSDMMNLAEPEAK